LSRSYNSVIGVSKFGFGFGFSVIGVSKFGFGFGLSRGFKSVIDEFDVIGYGFKTIGYYPNLCDTSCD